MPKPKSILAGLFGISLAGAAAWFIRGESWPCGYLDKTSGCVSSTALNVSALGLDPTGTKVDYTAFDIGPDAKVALIGFTGPSEDRYRSVLATFDTRTGEPIRVLRDMRGGKLEDKESTRSGFDHIALSADGSLAASWGWGNRDTADYEFKLLVQNTSDGSIARVVYDLKRDQRAFCSGVFDFTPDNRKLQCGSTVIDLATGEEASLSKDGNYVYPAYGDFSAGMAIAADGTEVRYDTLRRLGGDRIALKSPLRLVDSVQDYAFSPDSKHFLESYRAHRENRGARLYTPPVFRKLSAIAVWNADTRKLERSFFTNARYWRVAWSRDGAYFGMVNRDMTLQMFRR
jgi:hypothetical protein